MTRFPVPPEFQHQLIHEPKPKDSAEAVSLLEAFVREMMRELGNTPQLYQVNRARLALADRHELLRRGTPLRHRRHLTETFNRSYAELFDRSLALQVPELEPPPPPVMAPAPPPPPRRRSVAEAMAAALEELT